MTSPVQFDVYEIASAGTATPALVQHKTGSAADILTLDDAPTVGNLLLALVSDRGDPDGTVVTTGWTQVTTAINNAGSFVRGALAYVRVATGVNPNAEPELGEPAHDGFFWVDGPLASYETTLIEVSGSYGGVFAKQDSVSSTTDVTCGGSVSAPDNSLVFGIGSLGTLDSEYPGPSVTPDADVTELADTAEGSSAGNSPGHWVAYRTVTSSAAVDVGGTLSTSLPQCGITVVVSPFVSSGGGGGAAAGFLATLENAYEKEFRAELDGTGAFSFKINRNEPEATAAILGDGLDDFRIVKVKIPEVDRDEYVWAGIIEAGDFQLLSPDEEGGEVLTFGGRGLLGYLDRAVMDAESHIDTPFNGSNPFGGLWRLYNAGTGSKPGQILRRVIAELQASTTDTRTVFPIPLLTPNFDYTNDSHGSAWAASTATAEFSAQIGESVLSVAGRLIGTRAISLQMEPDFTLGAYNSYGRSLGGTAFGTAVVRLVSGTNIAEPGVQRQFAPNRVATHVLVTGENDSFARVALTDASSRVTREAYVSAYGTTSTTLSAIGTAVLNERLQRAESVSVTIVPGTATASGYYLPGGTATANGKVWVGDTIRLHTGSDDFDFNEQDLEVAAVKIKEPDAAVSITDCDITLELGSTTIATPGGVERFGSFLVSSNPGAAPSTSIAYPPAALEGQFLTSKRGAQHTISAHGAMGTAETIDLANGNVHTGTLDANCTITFDTWPSGYRGEVTVRLTENGTGGFTPTFSGVTWVGGTTPSHGTAANSVTEYVFWSDDGGSTITGGQIGAASTVADLDDLSDVTITSAQEDDDLRYNGSAWVNDARKWEVVTNGEDVFVWESDDLVFEWNG